MRKKAFLVMMLAALLAVPGAARADVEVIDFESVMQTLAQSYIALVSDYAYMFLHPTGIADLDAFATAQGHPDTFNPGDSQEACDNNGNGVVDVDEFKMLEVIFADVANPLHAAVHEAYKANITQLATDLGPLAASLAPTLKNVMAAYATIGDGSYNRYTYLGVDYGYGVVGSWGAVAEVIAGMDGYGSLWSENDAPSASVYGRFADDLGMCGDADGDTVANINEYYANPAEYPASALNDAVTASGADPNDACASSAGGWEFGRNLFYNPANGSVYAVVAEAIFPACRDIAEAFALGGVPIEGTLLHVNDAAENAFVADTIRPTLDGRIWLGLTDEVTEGTWLWVDDGTNVTAGYSNWNGGEPNNAGTGGEDYAELNTGGGWNDSGTDDSYYGVAEFTNGGTGYADPNSDGIPDYWASLMTLTDVTITGSPSEAILAGTTVNVEASSSDVDDTAFTWDSDTETVATVASISATEATVTAVGPGVAVITATANTSAASKSFAITVRAAEWFEVCPLVSVFPAEGAVLADAIDEVYETMDLDQDSVPDSWQLYLLAYDICSNPGGPAAAQYTANLAAMEQLGADLAAVAEWMGAGADGQLFHLGLQAAVAGAVLEADTAETTALFGALGGDTLTLLLAYPQVIGFVVTTDDLIDAQEELATYGPVIQFVLKEFMAGLIGLDSELRAGIPALLSLPTVEYLLDSGTPFTSQLMDIGGGVMVPIPLLTNDLGALAEMPLFPVMQLGAITDIMILSGVQEFVDGTYGAGTFAVAYPKSNALLVAMQAFLAKYNELGSDSFEIPEFAVYTVGAKLPGEPFSGLGDYDGDGVLNSEVYYAIQSQGGDMDDFLVGATGSEGPFWSGNPHLPVAGLTGLLTLAMALGSTAMLRRKK